MRRRALLLLGSLGVTTLPSALASYLIMPFPGSQTLDAGAVAYALYQVRWPSRAVGGALLILGAVSVLRRSRSRWAVLGVTAAAVLAGGVLFLSHRWSGAGLFAQPLEIRYARGTSEALPPETLILGVVREGGARAYPVRLLAYHHLVQDELGGEPLLPTY